MTNFDMIAFCKALSDGTRQQILEILQEEDELCVTDLVARFNVSQPTISHHLNFLKQANLVTHRRKGQQIFYRANQTNITECCGMLFSKFVPTELNLADFIESEAETDAGN